MTNRERLIREIAYDLWEQEGRPEGHSERLWLAAEARFETEIAERRDERSEPPVEPAVETPPRPTKRKADAAADELESAPSRSGSKDADTSLKSGISGRIQRATPFNRPPAKEPISLNSNSTRTKPTPTRSKDAKASPVSSGARPQPTNANANRAEARNRAREDEISDSANSVTRKSAKAGRWGKRTGCAAIGTEIPSWRSNDCGEMDEVEKAEGPPRLLM